MKRDRPAEPDGAHRPMDRQRRSAGEIFKKPQHAPSIGWTRERIVIYVYASRAHDRIRLR
jgi:hypothetical protein